MLLLDHLRFAHPVVETLVDGALGLHITLGNFFCPNPVSEPFPSSGISSSSHVRIMDIYIYIYIYIKNYWMDIYIYVCVRNVILHQNLSFHGTSYEAINRVPAVWLRKSFSSAAFNPKNCGL